MARARWRAGKGQKRKKLTTFDYYYKTYKNVAYGLASLTKEQFYTYTPIELFDFINAKAEYLRNKQESENIRDANLFSVITNSSGHYKKYIKPEDFLPKKKVVKEQTPEQQKELFKGFYQLMGGK